MTASDKVHYARATVILYHERNAPRDLEECQLEAQATGAGALGRAPLEARGFRPGVHMPESRSTAPSSHGRRGARNSNCWTREPLRLNYPGARAHCRMRVLE